jgi:hypothetical protein
MFQGSEDVPEIARRRLEAGQGLQNQFGVLAPRRGEVGPPFPVAAVEDENRLALVSGAAR